MFLRFFRYIFVLIFISVSLELAAQQINKKSLESLLTEFQVPGVQVSHVKKGIEVQIAAGLSNQEEELALHNQSIIQAASLSKVVAAYAAIRLAERGVYHLDTPLLSYISYPRLAHDDRAKTITGRMVLSHRSGLPNWANDTLLTIAFEPGTQHMYSGEGFQFLQEVLVHLEGKSFEQIMQDEVLKPFGMKASSFIHHDSLTDRYVHGHEGADGKTPTKMRVFKEGNAAYTLLTTAHDYNLFVQKGLLQGQGLSKKMHELMVSPAGSANARQSQDEAFNHLAFGLGVILQYNELGLNLVHTGSNGGRYLAVFWASPKTKESIVILTNSANGKNLYSELLKLMLPEQTQWFLKR